MRAIWRFGLDIGRERGRVRGAKKMNDAEQIVLDAVVRDVLEKGVYRASLANGHEFTAYVPGDRSLLPEGFGGPGTKVRVRMSPFDFSRGAIADFEEKRLKT